MAVSNTNTYNVSIANGATTTFPYTFTLLSEDDLVLEVDGVVVTTGFTVTGVGNAGGGNIIFDVAPDADAEVLRYRDMPLTRSTDYQYGGELPEDEIDQDFDRLWLAIQQVQRSINLGLSLPLADYSDISLELPEPVAGGYLRWNEDADALEYVTLLDTTDTPVSPFAAGLLEQTTAADFRIELGLGTLALQNAGSASISGGSISGVTLTSSTLGTGTVLNGVTMRSSTISTGTTATGITISGSAITGSSTIGTGTVATGITLNSSTVNGGAIHSGNLTATTSGTSVDFTSIPSWVKRITIVPNAVSTNGSSVLQVQLGDAGGIEVTGYDSTCSGTSNASLPAIVTSTTGLLLNHASSAGNTVTGVYVLVLLDAATNTWAMTGNCANAGVSISVSAGTKALSAPLDRIRLTTFNGTDIFDAGAINILYE